MPEESRKQESPIKASAQAKAALKRLVKGMGIRQIDVLEKAVTALEDYWKRHGNRALEPLRFDETFVVYKIVLPEQPDAAGITVEPKISLAQLKALQKRKAERAQQSQDSSVGAGKNR